MAVQLMVGWVKEEEEEEGLGLGSAGSRTSTLLG